MSHLRKCQHQICHVYFFPLFSLFPSSTATNAKTQDRQTQRPCRQYRYPKATEVPNPPTPKPTTKWPRKTWNPSAGTANTNTVASWTSYRSTAAHARKPTVSSTAAKSHTHVREQEPLHENATASHPPPPTHRLKDPTSSTRTNAPTSPARP